MHLHSSSMLPKLRIGDNSHSTHFTLRNLLISVVLLLGCRLFLLSPPKLEHTPPNTEGTDDPYSLRRLTDLHRTVDHMFSNLSSQRAPVDTALTGTSKNQQSHPEHDGGIILKPVHRVSNITTAEFNAMSGNMFVQAPIVFEDAMAGSYNPRDWTRDGIDYHCGERSIWQFPKRACQYMPQRCHQVREIDRNRIGKEWAGLKVTNLTELGIDTVSDFLRLQDSSHPSMYVHDSPVLRFCPKLMNFFQSPKYFPTDYLAISSVPGLTESDLEMYHPSIFIGKKGSGSPLHSDTGMTRFWLMQMSGSKLIRLIPPSENWATDAKDQQLFQPLLYQIDLMKPDYDAHPNMRNLLVYETTLHAGELMFIPAGWGHQVLNLEDIVATSQNFIDQESSQVYVRALREEPNTDDEDPADLYLQYTAIKSRMSAFYLPLIQPSSNNGHTDWFEYRSSHILEQAAVPQTVIDLVAFKKTPPLPDVNAPPTARLPTAQHPDEWTDDCGQSLLHVAVRQNFVSVVRFLIESGMDKDLVDTYGSSPLNTAVELELVTLAEYLAGIGAKILPVRQRDTLQTPTRVKK